MKHVDEYRDGKSIRRYVERIRAIATRPWTLMEICGGQTHAILRHGIDQLLPDIALLHGPGCPVCVTPAEVIDTAVALAQRSSVTLCSFGDMLRVPGNQGSLLAAKARGADVRMVYSPLDAVALARQLPDREVVFLAIGFETTAPTTAIAVLQAEQAALQNFSLLTAHVLVPPAIETILSDESLQIQGFLAAGHVCTVMGYWQYESIAQRFGVPIVITGFEPVDLLHGIYACVRQLQQGRADIENAYPRMVQRTGNAIAQQVMQQVFTTRSQAWRGMGEIPDSGLELAPRYARFDAAKKFRCVVPTATPGSACISGDILRGHAKPHQCPAYGVACTPEHPLGATMVSSEGACAAYYHYRRPVRRTGTES